MIKIIIMSDILRCSKNEKFYTDRACKWFYHLFNQQIEVATGIKVDIELAEQNRIFDRDKFYKLSGYNEVSEENYISICCGQISKASIDYFNTCFKNYFIIFQEAGSLKQIVDKTNIKYIDTFISSIRFMDDLCLAFRSNDTSIINKILLYKMDKNSFYYAANKIKSYYFARNCYKNSYHKNALLLCGQTEIDLSLIKNGKLVTFLDYEKEIKYLFNKYKKIYYKPHPYCNPKSQNEQFIKSFKNIELINENFYKLISTDEISAVAALSSGTLAEAIYFGKNVHYISHKFINYCFENTPSKDDFLICTNDYFSPTFWADILSPVISTNECKYFNFSNTNLLRDTLNVRWGYEIGYTETEKLKALTNNLQNQINSIVSHNTLIKQIFSIHNEYRNNKKFKIICILGFKIKINKE